MTSQLDGHTTNDVKPEILSGVQTGNGIPHYQNNICGIAHAQTYSKDDNFMQRRQFHTKTTSVKIYICIDEAHIALDISKSIKAGILQS